MGQKMEKFGKNVVFPEKYFFMKSSEFRVQSSESESESESRVRVRVRVTKLGV